MNARGELNLIHRFFIFGYFGKKNVGDDAMLYALLQELHSMNPESTFAILSPIPVIIPTEVKNRVKYVNHSLFMVAKEILKSSAFVVGGGTHLFDYGKIRAIRGQLRISFLVLYSKLIGKKVYLLGIGLGPLQTIGSKCLVRSICHIADYISVRDKTSFKFLMDWRLTKKASLTFDLSLLINHSSETERNPIRRNNRILGICVTPVFEIYFKNKEKDLLLIAEISKYANEWLKKEPKAEIHLFVFHGKSSRYDDALITRLLQKSLQPSDCVKLIPYDPDPRKILAQVGQCSAFIGMKYHSCVYAYIKGLPLLIIEYHPKCRAFGEEIGLPNRAIISLEEILNGEFGEYFQKMQEDPDGFVANLPIEIAKYRALLSM